MKTKVVAIAVAGLALLFIVGAVGCTALENGGDGGGTASVVEPTWIDASVDGNVVAIPISQVETSGIVNFRVANQGTNMAFTAYTLGQQLYVRSALCPPCRSESFSLDGDVLDCDTCHTRFSATTGDGLKGACRAYPKAEVQYSVAGDELTMDVGNLVTAYQETKNPG